MVGDVSPGMSECSSADESELRTDRRCEGRVKASTWLSGPDSGGEGTSADTGGGATTWPSTASRLNPEDDLRRRLSLAFACLMISFESLSTPSIVGISLSDTPAALDAGDCTIIPVDDRRRVVRGLVA
jgi:hypothetical protein